MIDRFDHTLERKLESKPDEADDGVVNIRRIELITGTGRRRRWPTTDKVRIVVESFEPGANVSEVAQRHGISPQQLFAWRREARALIAEKAGELSAATPVDQALTSEPRPRSCRPQPSTETAVDAPAFAHVVIAASPAAAPTSAPPLRVAEVGCWSHVRRGFFDEWGEHKSAIAKEALDHIGARFDIEPTIAGSPPENRRAVRQRTAKPKVDELAAWLGAQLAKIPGKSDLAKAIRYAQWRWHALTRYLDDGRLAISNNAAENKILPAALGRKNWLFCGSDAGGARAAAFYTPIGTARMNGIEPEVWLTDVIARIGAHPINRLAEPLSWNRSPSATHGVAA